MSDYAIKTERLILRPWREEDLEPFAQLNAVRASWNTSPQ